MPVQHHPNGRLSMSSHRQPVSARRGALDRPRSAARSPGNRRLRVAEARSMPLGHLPDGGDSPSSVSAVVVGGTSGYCARVRLPLPAPSDLFGLPGLVVDSIRALGDALTRAEALLPRADDIVTRVQALLDQATPAVARAAPTVPQVIDTTTRMVQQVADVLTPERTAALGTLISRLDAALTPRRLDGAAQALDVLQSRADVLP